MHTSISSPESNGCVLRKPTQEQIAAMAFHLFVEQGSYHGHELDDWLRAEQLLTLHLNESLIPPMPRPDLSAPHANEHESVDNCDRDYAFTLTNLEIPRRDDVRRQPPVRMPSRHTRAGRQPANQVLARRPSDLLELLQETQR